MPRPPRIEVAGGIYHVFAGSVTSRGLFYNDLYRERFMSLLNAVTARYSLEILGYVLLTTHYHLLVRIEERDLSRSMQWLNSRYGTVVNRMENERGHVFGGRFGSKLVTSDAQLLATIRYIARNPVEAGLRRRACEWPWSSYTVLVHGWRWPRFFNPTRVLWALDPHRDRAVRRLEAMVEDESLGDDLP